MIGKVVTGCVAILPYHTATQDRGSECRDFGFISRIVTALVLGISRYPEPRYQNRYREWKNVIGTSLFVIHDEVVIVNQYFFMSNLLLLICIQPSLFMYYSGIMSH